MKKRIILVLLSLVTMKFSVAQTELRYEHYTIENGLSSNYTTQIKQDKYGFLWVGTIDGLNRFNGYGFTNYFKKDNDLNSLSENSINDLLIDKQGTLWVATNIGLNKYIRPSDNFQRFFCGSSIIKSATENLIINAITENEDGNLWLSTNKGIRILNPVTNEIVQQEIKNDSLRKFIEDGIGAIYFGKNGVVWLGSSGGSGLRLINIKTWEPVTFYPENKTLLKPNLSVRGFYKDSKSTLWILSDNGLFSYQSDNNVLKRYVSSLRPNDSLTYEATSIIEDSNYQLWVSLAAQPPFYTSIAKINSTSNTFKIYPYKDNDDRGLSWSFASFIFQDKSGILWVGTSRGLDKMDPLCQQFKLYQSFSNLKYSQYNNVYSIYKDSATTWLGTDGKGLIKYDLKTRSFQSFFNHDIATEPATIYAFLPLTDGTLLLGTDNNLWQFNPKNNKANMFLEEANANNNLPASIGGIIKGENDDIWIAYMGGGLAKYNLKTREFKKYQHNKSDTTTINSNLSSIVFRDSRGIIWVGSSNGLNIIENGLSGNGLDRFNTEGETFTHFVHSDNDSNSISGNNIICMAEDKNGILWIGTRNNGLNKFDPKTGKFKHYTKSEGLPSNFITAIQIDDLNRIWMSTYTNGMACLDQSNNKIINIDITYGLQNIRFNRQSTFKTKDGELYFGGVSGFNSFFPSTIKFNTQAPPVLICGIKINNATYFSDSSVLDIKTLQLNYQQSELQFDFAAMNYSQSFKNQYAYQLVGYDKQWKYVGTERTAKYTNLDPGTYTFNVKACNNDGIWNETGATISIVILPPWWQTWWAYLIYFIAFVGALLWYIAYRSTRLKYENKVLEEKVALRTNQLESSLENLKSTQTQLVQQEKLASLGALTAGIAHEIKNPLNFVNNFAELTTELVDEFIASKDETERKEIATDLKLNLSKINEHGKRADSIVKNMLAHSRTGTSEKQLTDINQICEEYFNLAYHGKRATNANFNCEMIKQFDSNLPQLNCVAQDISRVILNLISNAFDAVREREALSESESEGERAAYRPTVTVITKSANQHIGSSSHQHISISIKDSGKGIPSDKLEKIFEPFFTTKAAGQGTGLGLSLSNDIIKAHGGELKVESREGEGSEFIITLPIV